MITDEETNVLYLADSLKKKKYSAFLERFEKTLKENSINPEFLTNTKDIWAVDYMPIQIGADKFIQFIYNPDYLQNKTQAKTISDVDAICKYIPINPPIKSKIKVDGGNVIRAKNKIIMCDKVFSENPAIPRKELIKKLTESLEIEKIIFVPWDKSDFTGHADGMVRFIDDNTVLINKYSKKDEDFKRYLTTSLHNAGLDWEEITYNPYNNKPKNKADGVYINYLQMNNIVIMPTFNNPKEDEEARETLEGIFGNVATVESNEISKAGGILNCISWNIKSNK